MKITALAIMTYRRSDKLPEQVRQNFIAPALHFFRNEQRKLPPTRLP